MAMMTRNSEFRFTGYHMLACMFAFFGVIIVVNFTMASFASKSWTGLVVKNSYVASQKFNDELALAEAQKARGWRSTVTYEEGKLAFALFDKAGQPIAADKIMLSIGRPAFEQLDQVIEMQADTPSGATTPPASQSPLQLEDGSWALKIEALVGETTYRRDLRLFVSGSKGVIE